MINVFQLNFEARLRSWYDLRKSLENADTETKCLEIDKWWQNAPLVNNLKDFKVVSKLNIEQIKQQIGEA